MLGSDAQLRIGVKLDQLTAEFEAGEKRAFRSIGPRGPDVREFWLSGTGAPAAVVNGF
ncbi:hypothetical protein [Streptomyces sp. NPDC003863]